MRYLLFIILLWQSLWLMFLSYAIYDGALEVARDKGTLMSAWGFIALILIVIPLIALGSGWIISKMSFRQN